MQVHCRGCKTIFQVGDADVLQCTQQEQCNYSGTVQAAGAGAVQIQCKHIAEVAKQFSKLVMQMCCSATSSRSRSSALHWSRSVQVQWSIASSKSRTSASTLQRLQNYFPSWRCRCVAVQLAAGAVQLQWSDHNYSRNYSRGE